MQNGTSAFDTGELHVCTACFKNNTFSHWIEENGKKGECDFNNSHGSDYKIAKISDFAEMVDVFFRAKYQLGEQYPYFEGDSESPTYGQRGEPYKDILAQELDCKPDVIDEISKNLPDADWHDISQGDTAFYDDTQNYESIEAAQKRSQEDWEEYWYENSFSYQWEEFCSVVQYERRFFKTKELLDELFGEPAEYDEGTVRPVYNLKVGTKLFRTRLLDHDFTAEKLSSNPGQGLGAPPKDKARAGRMNVEYIPAFYAAFSEATAIAEIRPGIGDEVAIGEFLLTKELRVFDFTVFSSQKSDDWKEARKHTRYDFIAEMEDEISKPISPFSKQREYIPTQIVAEYLREYFACDAVIYKSAMSKTDQADNRNIVILNRGADFVGASPQNSVSYRKHKIKEIYNVIYTMNDEIPF